MTIGITPSSMQGKGGKRLNRNNSRIKSIFYKINYLPTRNPRTKRPVRVILVTPNSTSVYRPLPTSTPDRWVPSLSQTQYDRPRPLSWRARSASPGGRSAASGNELTTPLKPNPNTRAVYWQRSTAFEWFQTCRNDFLLPKSGESRGPKTAAIIALAVPVWVIKT